MQGRASANADIHVLMVGGSSEEQFLMRQQLQVLDDVRMSLAPEGERGLQRAVTLQPTIVLLDAELPDEEGLRACRQLRAQARTAQTPLILIGPPEARLAAYTAGATDYLLRPLLAAEVKQRMALYLHMREAPLSAPAIPAAAADKVSAIDSRQMLVAAARQAVARRDGSLPSPTELAASLGVSPRRLSRAFQQIENVTLFTFLRDERMKLAKELLAQTALSVVAIAEEVGFSSAANFSTAFLDYVGMTPTNYRAHEDRPAPHVTNHRRRATD